MDFDKWPDYLGKVDPIGLISIPCWDVCLRPGQEAVPGVPQEDQETASAHKVPSSMWVFFWGGTLAFSFSLKNHNKMGTLKKDEPPMHLPTLQGFPVVSVALQGLSNCVRTAGKAGALRGFFHDWETSRKSEMGVLF